MASPTSPQAMGSAIQQATADLQQDGFGTSLAEVSTGLADLRTVVADMSGTMKEIASALVAHDASGGAGTGERPRQEAASARPGPNASLDVLGAYYGHVPSHTDEPVLLGRTGNWFLRRQGEMLDVWNCCSSHSPILMRCRASAPDHRVWLETTGEARLLLPYYEYQMQGTSVFRQVVESVSTSSSDVQTVEAGTYVFGPWTIHIMARDAGGEMSGTLNIFHEVGSLVQHFKRDSNGHCDIALISDRRKDTKLKLWTSSAGTLGEHGYLLTSPVGRTSYLDSVAEQRASAQQLDDVLAPWTP